MCCTDQYPVFAGSDMSINLLSANHGNAWNVLMPGILVVGGVAWRGVGHWKLRPGSAFVLSLLRLGFTREGHDWLVGYLSSIWRVLRPKQ